MTTWTRDTCAAAFPNDFQCAKHIWPYAVVGGFFTLFIIGGLINVWRKGYCNKRDIKSFFGLNSYS